MSSSPRNEEEVEDCNEMDEDYFSMIGQTFSIVGQTFSVVDCWGDDDEENTTQQNIEEDVNNSKPFKKVSNTKKEKSKDTKENQSTKKGSTSFSLERQEGRSSESKRSSQEERRSSRESKRSSQEKRRQSPEKRRSPERKRVSQERRSSAERGRLSQERSSNKRSAVPPRRNSIGWRPPVRITKNKNTFLLELKDKLAKEGIVYDSGVEEYLQQGKKIDWKTVKEKPELHSNFPIQNPVVVNPPMMNQYNPMIGMPTAGPSNLLAQYPFDILPQFVLNGMAPGPPQGFNMQGPPPAQFMAPNIPQPVPPPYIDHIISNQSSHSPLLMENFNNNRNEVSTLSSFRTENESNLSRSETVVERPPQKKVSNEQSTIPLIEMLRQKSKKNTKSTVRDDPTSANSRVLERCKEAVNLITDLEKNKSKIPVSCIMSDYSHITKVSNRSPLLVNESNPTFLFQATSENCHTVLENHPIRNIYGPIMDVAQYLKLDLLELSKNVAQESAVKYIKRDLTTPVPESSKSNQQATKKTVSKEVQTDNLTCKNCTKQEMIRQTAKNISCQTNTVNFADAGTQHTEEEEEGSFRVIIDARTMIDRNFEQHHALQVFTKAFGIDCPYLSPSREHSRERISRRQESLDDRMSYTNPENPAGYAVDTQVKEEDQFISTSPIRESSYRVRGGIFNRIGQKVTNSPNYEQNFRPYRVPSPDIKQEYDRNLSPLYRERSRSRSRDRSRQYSNRSRSRSISPSRRNRNRNRYQRDRNRSRSPLVRNDVYVRVGNPPFTKRRGRY